MMRGNKGITLIALVVTIIVLLILAGISIAMLTGTNGIITRGRESKTENIRGTEKEQISLAFGAEKSNLLENENVGNVKAQDLENRLKSDGANIINVEDKDGILKINFNTGNVYYIDNSGNVTNKPVKIGAYVKYNVPYTDMYTEYEFTENDGWRILEPGIENQDGTYTGTKLISTGIPARLSYNYR